MAEQNNEASVTRVTVGMGEQPVPSDWRLTFVAVVDAFVRHDYALVGGVPRVQPVSLDTATQIRRYIEDYGTTLVPLPSQTWDSSVCIWTGSYWDVLIDIWTEEEGRSDLVLSARVSEADSDFSVEIHMVYVP
jgi:hypothetical protein